MATKYETPALMELGSFQEKTGELFGPFTELILPFRDYSDEG
ncbi:keywimysin-related RiPP [Brevibacterium luteolum]|nr:keywimysin-related RiPP [Brevibacterium luteolum]MBU8579694.1 lasso RiPP family leader peptide-containing protein [Brevibacterium luteolum]